MGFIKGSIQYNKWKRGEQLTRKESMLAKCYECNGYEESRVDCEVEGCPLYQYHPHRSKS